MSFLFVVSVSEDQENYSCTINCLATTASRELYYVGNHFIVFWQNYFIGPLSYLFVPVEIFLSFFLSHSNLSFFFLLI